MPPGIRGGALGEQEFDAVQVVAAVPPARSPRLPLSLALGSAPLSRAA